MIQPSREKLWYGLLLVVGLAVWFIGKWPHLSLPFYWDEAWSYAPAVKAMTEGRLSLLPHAIDPELSKGHPLLFYFMSASWLRIFDWSLFAAHAYAITISMGTLGAIFLLARKVFDTSTGTLATLAFLSSGLFIAQSSRLLPEMQLAMFSLLAIYCYLHNRLGWFVVFATAAVLTKESGIVMIGAVGLYHLGYLWNHRGAGQWRPTIAQLLTLSIPLLVYGAFLLLQYRLHGWWFYPEHIHLMDTNFSRVWKNLQHHVDFIFWFKAKHFLYFLGSAFAIIALVRRQFSSKEQRLFAFIAIFLPSFLIFSAINFETKRYLITVIVFVTIMAAAGVNRILRPFPMLKNVAILLLPLVVAVITYGKVGTGDINPYHVQSIRLHEQAFDYLRQKQWHERSIATTFLLEFYAEHPACGYIQEPFPQVDGWNHTNAEVYLISSTEQTDSWKQFRQNHGSWLHKRWEAQNGSWVEVYVKDREGG